MVVQYGLPMILLVGSIFFPESAYFLVKKGKMEAAEKALRRTHGSNDQQFLDIELKRLTENVRYSEELKKQAAIGGPLLYQCFRGTNLVIPALIALILEAYIDSDITDNCPANSRCILFRWLYVFLSLWLTLDITYFLELIGISQAFDITCAIQAVNIAATIVAFGLIEVCFLVSILTTGGWSS